MEIVNGDVVTRKRKSQALRGDYLKITKDELRKELKQRGLRGSNKRHEMIRKLEKWELDRRARKAELSPTDSSQFDSAKHSFSAESEISRTTTTTTSTSIAKPHVDLFCGSGDGSLFQMSLLQENAGRSRQSASNRVPLSLTTKDRKSAGDHSNSPPKSAVDLHTERQGIVLWKRPLATTHFFVAELVALLGDLIAKLWHNKFRVSIASVGFVLCVIAYRIEGEHQQLIKPMERTLLWCAYWVGLGILSSVGLGTGLHTFLLYLGPHIAAVTLAASTCKSLDFPEPPYPDEIVCPEGEADGAAPGILAIVSKVRLEAFMWGAGTALGELPPYFMARAARISGEMDEDELEVLEEIKALEKSDVTQLSFLDRAKLAVENLIEKVGFLGILACASIPNPLFDVAGFMCGHFLVPFRTFFGATFIGKAVFKMHIQKLFVIFAFDGAHVEMLLSLIKGVPVIGPRIEAPFEEFLQKQKDKLHRKGEHSGDGNSMLSQVFEKFVLLMVLYFLVSIVNSMAQNYHKRINRRSSAKHGKKY